MNVCVRCGHAPCTACSTWCDVVLRDGNQKGEVELCCDGTCLYPDGTGLDADTDLARTEREHAARLGLDVLGLYATHVAVPRCHDEAGGWEIDPRSRA